MFYLNQKIFNLPYKFGYHEAISFNTDHLYFNITNYTYKNIPKAIIEVAEQDFVISDKKIEGVDVVPYDDFNKIVQGMPNRYHFDLYFDNKIEEIIQEHLEIRKSKIEKFENYLKKKGTINQYSSTVISEYEISKYESIYDEIKTMLEEDNISEVVWQNKLLEILPLIYPEFVCVLKEVEFINEHKQKRRIDFLLVDANGYIIVLELKRPFKDRVISNSKYRYNHLH